MAEGKTPRPYTQTCKKDENLMQYIDTDHMGIGARRSGMPMSPSEGPKSIEHVGKDASTSNGKK